MIESTASPSREKKTNRTILATFLVVHLVIVSAWAATETISVADFGVHPNSRENAVVAVRKALEVCRAVKNALLVFPKGRYDFWPQHAQEKVYYESNSYDNNPKTCAILIENCKGLTIDCSGSEFVFHGRMQPFTLERCEGVTIRNVTIDWDIPLTAQGEVADVGTLCYLVGLRNPEHAASGRMGGEIMETAILSEIFKALTHKRLEPQVYFWRTSAGTEVDIIVDVDGKLVPIEVKLSATIRPDMASGIRDFQKDLGDRAAPGYVVHPGDVSLPLGPRVTALPFAEL